MKRIWLIACLIVLMLLCCQTAYGGLLCRCVQPTFELIDVKMPTCTTAGIEVYRCKVCGQEREVTKGRPLPHNWELTHINRDDVDCAVGGTAYYVCKGCGAQRNEGVDPEPHDYQVVFATAAMCEAPGTVKYECSVCGDTYSEEGDAPTGHSMREIDREEPGCTTPGKVIYECGTCGKKESETIQPTNHAFGEWTVIQQPGDGKPGLKEAICANCGRNKIEEFEGTAAEQPTPKPETAVTPKPEAAATEKPKATKKPEAVATKKPEAAKQPEVTKAPAKQYDISNLVVEGAGVQVYIMAENVNLRAGAGVQNAKVGSIAHASTLLGQLTQAALDDQDTVWFAAMYKDQEVWVSSQFSCAVVGDIDYSMERVPFDSGLEPSEFYMLPGGMELSNYYLCSTDIVAEALHLDEVQTDESGFTVAKSWALRVGGKEYVEYITLSDGGYTVYGAGIGMPVSEAAALVEEAGLYCMQKGMNEYMFANLCSPKSLYIDEKGFDSCIQIAFDQNGVVNQILWFPLYDLNQ